MSQHHVVILLSEFKSGVGWIRVTYAAGGALKATALQTRRRLQVLSAVRDACEAGGCELVEGPGPSYSIHAESAEARARAVGRLYSRLAAELVETGDGHNGRSYVWPRTPRIHPIVREMRDAVKETGGNV